MSRELPLVRPTNSPAANFHTVLESRRSQVGGSVTWLQVGDLLWNAVGARGMADAGRAGLPIQWSATPSAGGLAAIHIICISDDGSPARLYDPLTHSFFELAADAAPIAGANQRKVGELIGPYRGCTLRLVGDRAKLDAAYFNSDSLLFRDAGAVIGTIGLCASWLGLTACALGFTGDDFVHELGYPSDRFRGAGGIQIGAAL